MTGLSCLSSLADAHGLLTRNIFSIMEDLESKEKSACEQHRQRRIKQRLKRPMQSREKRPHALIGAAVIIQGACYKLRAYFDEAAEDFETFGEDWSGTVTKEGGTFEYASPFFLAVKESGSGPEKIQIDESSVTYGADNVVLAPRVSMLKWKDKSAKQTLVRGGKVYLPNGHLLKKKDEGVVWKAV